MTAYGVERPTLHVNPKITQQRGLIGDVVPQVLCCRISLRCSSAIHTPRWRGRWYGVLTFVSLRSVAIMCQRVTIVTPPPAFLRDEPIDIAE